MYHDVFKGFKKNQMFGLGVGGQAISRLDLFMTSTCHGPSKEYEIMG